MVDLSKKIKKVKMKVNEMMNRISTEIVFKESINVDKISSKYPLKLKFLGRKLVIFHYDKKKRILFAYYDNQPIEIKHGNRFDWTWFWDFKVENNKLKNISLYIDL